MTQVLDMPLPDSRASEQKLVLGVCFAHFVSHYYITLLAPLFVFIKEDYAVSYTDLGLALTAFNVASTVLQTPTGFLVDRVNARLVIIALAPATTRQAQLSLPRAHHSTVHARCSTLQTRLQRGRFGQPRQSLAKLALFRCVT